MRRALRTLLLCAGVAGPAGAHVAPPTVVELFTAQGCAPCVKVGEKINAMADRPGVLVVTWPVDYWDYLGWKDTFAQPQFDDRQKAYDHRFGLRDVYTPQVVVDGDLQGSGAQPGRVEAMVREAKARFRDPPQMRFLGADRVAVGSGPRPRHAADVWIVRFDPRAQSVEVKSGDNRGRTIVQRNVVRQFARLGPWTGYPRVFRLPPSPDDGLATVVLLQRDHGGRILAARQLAPPPS